MPVLEISFLAGRYHATAWGRNVNEGEPEWPPSPFRLARALMDVRYRRHADIDDDSLERALLLLTGAPRFSLPPASRMAVKYYLDQGKTDGKKQAVLDAFVCMPKGAALYMELPQEASADALRVLETLVTSLPYLGRAESWIAARLRAELPPQRRWNCRLAAAQSADPDNQTEVHTLLSPTAYADLPCLPMTGKGKKKRACSWLEALALTTETLRADGWNRHPLLGRCVYVTADDESPSRRSLSSTDAGPCCVTYAIRSTPLPSVPHTLPLAERVRIGLMSRHKRCCDGDESRVSPLFSGKDALSRPLRGHQHAFYWPCDTDGDGRLDHVRVLLPGGLTREERQALEGLRHVWTQGAELAELVFLHCLPHASFASARTVVSATPVVLARHYKPRQGTFREWLEAEIRRSCAEQGLPEPLSVEPLPCLPVRNGAPLLWNSFIRQRKGQPPRRGYGFRLHFAAPVPVPFAIGSLAHFGLGLFVAEGVEA